MCLIPWESLFYLPVKERDTDKETLLQGKAFLPEGNSISQVNGEDAGNGQGEKRFPTLCLCHGIPGGTPKTDPSRTNPDEDIPQSYRELARWFSREGFASFTFNFRGTGESGGNFDLWEWTNDLEAVIRFIRQHPRVDREQIFLVGFSAGAAVCLYAASRNPDICGVASLACPADFRLLINEGNLQEVLVSLRNRGILRDPDFPRNPKAWMNRALHLRPQEYIRQLSPRPVLIIHGEKDELIPAEHALRLYRAASPPKELCLIEGAGHRLRHNKKALTRTLSWLKELIIR